MLVANINKCPYIYYKKIKVEPSDDIKEFTNEVDITEHAYQRAKERLSLNNKALDRMAVKAYVEGIKHSDTTGKLNKYITGLWGKYKTANNIRIYGEVIFLFAKNRLITVYQIPNEFKKILKHYR